jgi:ribosomal protein L37AE/L43A
MTEKEVLRRIKGLDEGTQKKMVCALVGHSRIQEISFYYYYCARCGAQVGDSLGGCYPEAKNVVVVGHNCDTCKENYKKFDWQDKFLAPDPFDTKEERNVNNA